MRQDQAGWVLQNKCSSDFIYLVLCECNTVQGYGSLDCFECSLPQIDQQVNAKFSFKRLGASVRAGRPRSKRHEYYKPICMTLLLFLECSLIFAGRARLSGKCVVMDMRQNMLRSVLRLMRHTIWAYSEVNQHLFLNAVSVHEDQVRGGHVLHGMVVTT